MNEAEKSDAIVRLARAATTHCVGLADAIAEILLLPGANAERDIGPLCASWARGTETRVRWLLAAAAAVYPTLLGDRLRGAPPGAATTEPRANDVTSSAPDKDPATGAREAEGSPGA